MSGKLHTCTLASRFCPSVIIQHHHIRRLLPACPHLLVRGCLADVQTETLAVQVDLIARRLQNLRNVPRVLKLPEIDVRPALLDGVTNQLGGTGLTLGANDGSLLLLASLVDNEGGTLRFLLGDLLRFDGGGELGRESQVLQLVRNWSK
jgi:hypothetical protein